VNEFGYTISLRIRHPSIDPAELTQQLGVAPRHSWRAGQPKPEEQREHGSVTYRETYWLAEFPSPPPDFPRLPLDGALTFALLHIKRCEAFWTAMLAGGGQARLIVDIFGRQEFTLDLSQITLSMLARYGIAISVDVRAELRAVA
jgi:hypothetical protein